MNKKYVLLITKNIRGIKHFCIYLRMVTETVTVTKRHNGVYDTTPLLIIFQ